LFYIVRDVTRSQVHCTVASSAANVIRAMLLLYPPLTCLCDDWGVNVVAQPNTLQGVRQGGRISHEDGGPYIVPDTPPQILLPELCDCVLLW